MYIDLANGKTIKSIEVKNMVYVKELEEYDLKPNELRFHFTDNSFFDVEIGKDGSDLGFLELYYYEEDK